MTHSLLIHPTQNPMFNIGDYVQAIAARQFCASESYGYVDRELLNKYEGDKTKVIMNGWFMFTDNWPPSDQIDPLFVAFHINSSADEILLSKESIEYLKKHEPIGCRDYRTRDILLKKGVDAYFSACLTLTLGLTYRNSGNGTEYYIVDPVVEPSFKLRDICSYIWTFISKPQKVLKIYRKVQNKQIMTLSKVIVFLSQYRKLISEDILLQAHYPSVYVKNSFENEDQKFVYADECLNRYANAKLVITSRIHCQMPCIAMNTPVLFLKNENDALDSTCRFGGLSDLYNTINYKKGSFSSTDIDLSSPIKYGTEIRNKTNHMGYVKDLVDRCKEFVMK